MRLKKFKWPIPPTLKLSIFLNANKTKKSKRKDRATPLDFCRKMETIHWVASVHLFFLKFVQKSKSHQTHKTKHKNKKKKRKKRKQFFFFFLEKAEPQRCGIHSLSKTVNHLSRSCFPVFYTKTLKTWNYNEKQYEI